MIVCKGAPKISVIIPSHNHGRFLPELIASLDQQSFDDFEVLVIEDKSTDNSPKIVSGLHGRHQYRIYVNSINRGVVWARNFGLSRARGEYVCFLDSDDRISPDRFKLQVAMLDDHPNAGLVYGDCRLVDTEGRPDAAFSDIFPAFKTEITKNLFLKYNFIPAITVMTRRSTLQKTGPFSAPPIISEYLKWIEVSAISEVIYSKEIVGDWRLHSANMTRNLDFETYYLEVSKSLITLERRNFRVRSLIYNQANQRYMRNYLLIAFNFLSCNRDVSKACIYVAKAASEYKSVWLCFLYFLLRYTPKWMSIQAALITEWIIYRRKTKLLR